MTEPSDPLDNDIAGALDRRSKSASPSPDLWSRIAQEAGTPRRSGRFLAVAAAAIVAVLVSAVLVLDRDDDRTVESIDDPTPPTVVSSSTSTTGLPSVDVDPDARAQAIRRRGQGQCDTPIPVQEDEFGITEASAEVLVRAFLADRVAGVGGAACLTNAALALFNEVAYGDNNDLIRLCLFECAEHSLSIDVEALVSPGGYSGRAINLSMLHLIDGTQFREEYRIDSLDGFGVIASVSADLASWVEPQAAHVVLIEFLLALREDRYVDAAGYLINEGISQRVLDLLETSDDNDGTIYELEVLAAALERYCGDALCDAAEEIGEGIDVQPFSRTFLVRFAAGGADVTATMGVGVFEGQLTVLDLPPLR